MPTMLPNPAGGVINTAGFSRGAGVVRPRSSMARAGMPTQGFEGGGYVDEEDIEGQGADDSMIDPMQYVSSALNYGKKKYGIPTDDEEEMGFEDGGVVPTEQDTAQGNPNATDPRQALAYLAGDGAVSPEIAQALEQRIDPQGQMNQTQRATAAIGVAPTDEARFGLLQHYRTKYNAYSGAAKAALARGDMGEAAQQATMAMDNVPDGQRTQFAPTANGFAKISRPAFGSSGGGQRQAPRQQAFQDGGTVEEDDETQDYAVPEVRPTDEPVMPDITQEEPPAPVPDYIPEPVTDPQATMPRQSGPAAPEVVPAQELVRVLDEGFDAKLIRPKSAAERMAPSAWQQGVTEAYQQPAPSPTGAGGFTEAEIAARPRSVVGQAGQWLDRQIAGALKPSTYAPLDVPPRETGIERDAPLAAPAAAAPVTTPAAPAAAAPVTAPVTPRPARSPAPQPTGGAVIDDERWNPFTRRMRPAAEGAFATRSAAARAGTDVPVDAAAAGASAQGVVPTGRSRPDGAGPGFPTYKTYEPRQQQGVVPVSTDDRPFRMYTPLRTDSPEVLKAAQTIPEFRAIPAKGAPIGDRSSGIPGTEREYDKVLRNLRMRIPEHQWGNITSADLQQEADRLRAAQRNDILKSVRDQLEPVRPDRIPSAQEAALTNFYKMQREGGPNNFRDPTGTINVQTDPRSTARDFQNRAGRPPNEEEAELERIQRAAAAAHPWVGAGQKAREASVEAGIKRSDEDKKEITKQEIIERRAGARDLANLEKTDVLERGRTDRANKLAQDNLERDRQKQAAQMRVTQVRAKLSAASQAERDYLRHLDARIRADSSYARPENVGKLINSAAPIMRSLKLRPEELLQAAEIAGSYDATSGTYDPKYGTGYGGPGGAAPAASEGGAYPEGIAVGTPVPYNYKGKSHTYILGPDGKTMWREDKYKERFGGR